MERWGWGGEGVGCFLGSKHQLFCYSEKENGNICGKNIQNLFSHATVLHTDIKQADITFIQSIVSKYALLTSQILMTAKCGVFVTSCVKIVWDITSATVWKVIF